MLSKLASHLQVLELLCCYIRSVMFSTNFMINNKRTIFSIILILHLFNCEYCRILAGHHVHLYIQVMCPQIEDACKSESDGITINKLLLSKKVGEIFNT